MLSVQSHIQVNVPFPLLREKYLRTFIEECINPEIGLDAVSLESFSFSDFRSTAKELKKHQLTITLHAPFMDLSPGSPDPGVWKLTMNRFKQVLRLVPLFQPRAVVCHAGYEARQYHAMRDAWVERSLMVWSWLGARIRDQGSRLMLENVYEEGPEDMRMLFENLEPEQVGFCLDTGHQNAFSRSTMSQWLSSLSPYLGELHLHDNDGTGDHHLALGSGTVNFSFLFERLKARGGSRPLITLEPHREEYLRPSIEALRNLWPW